MTLTAPREMRVGVLLPNTKPLAHFRLFQYVQIHIVFIFVGFPYEADEMCSSFLLFVYVGELENSDGS